MKSFLSDYGVGALLLLTSAIGSWIGGYFKGKKVSTGSVNTKDTVYQPLIDELTCFSTYDLDVNSELAISFLNEVVNNDYKYSFDKNIADDLRDLKELIDIYHSIRLDVIAYNVLIRQFILGFEELYGSIIDGISYHTTRDGGEYECEEEVLELKILQTSDFSKEIKSLLFNENRVNYAIRLNEDYEEYVYEQIIKIYNTAFYTSYEGNKAPNRTMKVEWNGAPSEYIAYKHDFFKVFNDEEKVIEKYELREEIIVLTQSIVQKIKEKMRAIVDKYEKEVI